MEQNYYRILGVGIRASQAEIRTAYRRLAKVYHPDVNRKPSAKMRFVEVKEAYETLADPMKRRRYDRFLRSGQQRKPAPDYSYDFAERVRREAYQKYKQEQHEKVKELENKRFVREVIIGVVAILLIINIPAMTSFVSGLRLTMAGNYSWGEVVTIDPHLVCEFSDGEKSFLVEPDIETLKVRNRTVLPTGLPVVSGDQYLVRYLPSNPANNRIIFDRPSERTLEKYKYEAYLTLYYNDPFPGFRNSASACMCLLDSIFEEYGPSGLSDIIHAHTLSMDYEEHNMITYQRLTKTQSFQRMVNNCSIIYESDD